MVSTIGTARGTTHGSCLPLASRVPADPSYRAVDCAWAIVAGGLKAILYHQHHPSSHRSFHKVSLSPASDSPEIDILPITDSTLHPSTPVGLCPQTSLRVGSTFNVHVIVLASREHGPSEPRTDLEALRRRDRKHRVCEGRLELVKAGLAESERGVPDDTGKDAAEGVVCCFGCSNGLEIRRVRP